MRSARRPADSKHRLTLGDLFWIIAVIAASALVLSVLTFDDAPLANPDSPRDLPAIALAALGCVAAFARGSTEAA